MDGKDRKGEGVETDRENERNKEREKQRERERERRRRRRRKKHKHFPIWLFYPMYSNESMDKHIDRLMYVLIDKWENRQNKGQTRMMSISINFILQQAEKNRNLLF